MRAIKVAIRNRSVGSAGRISISLVFASGKGCGVPVCGVSLLMAVVCHLSLRIASKVTVCNGKSDVLSAKIACFTLIYKLKFTVNINY